MIFHLSAVRINDPGNRDTDAEKFLPQQIIFLLDDVENPLQLMDHDVVIIIHGLINAFSQNRAAHIADREAGAVKAERNSQNREAVLFEIQQDRLAPHRFRAGGIILRLFNISVRNQLSCDVGNGRGSQSQAVRNLRTGNRSLSIQYLFYRFHIILFDNGTVCAGFACHSKDPPSLTR